MTNVLLCSTEYMKANLPINLEIDSQLLEPAILLAADKYVLPILGSTLYNRICDDVRAGTISGNYSALTATYIRPVVMHFALYEVIPYILFRTTNITLGKKHNDTTDAASLDEMNMVRRAEFDNGGYYAERLTRYLRANDSLFSEYLNYTATADTIPPAPTQYFGGIHIPAFFPYYGGSSFGMDFASSVQFRNWMSGLASRTPWVG